MSDYPPLKGKIFNIQRFSTHDGPGARTTVFLKGCPLRCYWCQNPESHAMEPSLLYNAEMCIGCGRCARACSFNAAEVDIGKAEIDRTLCTGCGECVYTCPTDALSLAGKEMTVNEVVTEILKDRTLYLNSGGGVTLSGGEPLVQHKFSKALLKCCKEKNIHTVIETCGYADLTAIQEIAPYVDLFLYDIKTLNNEKHIEGTKSSNNKIIENATWLARTGNKITLRMPIVPGFNDSAEDVNSLLVFAKDLALDPTNVDLLKYNALGEVKYKRLGFKLEKGQRAISPQSDRHFDYLLSLLR